MSDNWLTYAQAAERLNTTVEGVRLRALRGRWQKTIGNDKRPRIRLPEGWSNDIQTTVERRERKPRNDVRTTFELAKAEALANALESHIKTLQADLSAARDQLAVAEARSGEEAGALREHNATLKADVEKLEALLATERQRADAAITGVEALVATESERADRAIAAFEQLALRLEAMAAERAIKPWWQWILRRAG